MHNRIADDISLSLRLSLSFEAYKYENALHEPPNQNEMEIIVRMHKSIVCCPHMRNSTDFSFVCVFGVSRYGTWMMMSRCVFFLGFFCYSCVSCDQCFLCFVTRIDAEGQFILIHYPCHAYVGIVCVWVGATARLIIMERVSVYVSCRVVFVWTNKLHSDILIIKFNDLYSFLNLLLINHQNNCRVMCAGCV